MRLSIKDTTNFKVYNNSPFDIYKAPEDFLLFHDIRNDQTSPIGELHYDRISLDPTMMTVFTGDNGFNVVRNEVSHANNRINYNLEEIPNIFTAIFDYKAYGEAEPGGNGGYFYFYAKGEQNPNDGIICSVYDPEYDEFFSDACDSFPIGKYSSVTEGSYRVHFEEETQDPQLAITWNGYVGDNLNDRYTVCQTALAEEFPLGFTFEDDIWRTIKIQFNNGNFKIFINNFLRLDCTDPFFNSRDKSGKNLGLGGYVSNNINYHYFKNFKLYSTIV